MASGGFYAGAATGSRSRPRSAAHRADRWRPRPRDHTGLDRGPRPDDPLPARRSRPGPSRAERLITDLPSCPIPEIARLGRTLGAWRGEFLAHFDLRVPETRPTAVTCRSSSSDGRA